MSEIWKCLKTLPRGLECTRGEMPLGKAVGSASFGNFLTRLPNLDDGQRQMVVELIARVAPEFENVSALRKRLATNPRELGGLDENETRTLLVLFIDKRTAVEYKWVI